MVSLVYIFMYFKLISGYGPNRPPGRTHSGRVRTAGAGLGVETWVGGTRFLLGC